MNIYTIEARVSGSYWIPDYKCPPGWRGSGVYDKEVPCMVDITAEVTAENEARAQELIENYDYDKDRNNPWDIGVDVVDILNLTDNGRSEDEKEFVEITEYGDCKGLHPEREDDPDDLYDRRRDDRGTGDD